MRKCAESLVEVHWSDLVTSMCVITFQVWLEPTDMVKPRCHNLQQNLHAAWLRNLPVVHIPSRHTCIQKPLSALEAHTMKFHVSQLSEQVNISQSTCYSSFDPTYSHCPRLTIQFHCNIVRHQNPSITVHVSMLTMLPIMVFINVSLNQFGINYNVKHD